MGLRMDILDQIDRALREVDEDGYFTDAMRWVPDGSADAQEADLSVRPFRRLQLPAIRGASITHAIIDEAVVFEVAAQAMVSLRRAFEAIGTVLAEFDRARALFPPPEPSSTLERVQRMRTRRNHGPTTPARPGRRIDPRGHRT